MLSAASFFFLHLNVFGVRSSSGYKKKIILGVPPCKKGWETLDLSDNAGKVPKHIRTAETTSEEHT